MTAFASLAVFGRGHGQDSCFGGRVLRLAGFEWVGGDEDLQGGGGEVLVTHLGGGSCGVGTHRLFQLVAFGDGLAETS